MEYTKGPWYSSYRTDDGLFIRSENRSLAVCKVIQNIENPAGEDEANANLIAAAPEMLEELEQLREALNDSVLSTGSKTMDDEILYNIRKIIATARGVK